MSNGVNIIRPEEMISVAQKITDLMERWTDDTTNITQAIKAMGEMWQGAANDEFNNSYANDLKKMEQLVSVMQEYRNAIITIANATIDKENEIAGIAKK
ncbi:MAG: WXG100 family type VII secretion target [Clostridium sp.]|nr:WXG100 family type VII secretion target [Clostridium sp.]MCM1207709.1 WXG100 family type VII secretion target [Ruminococcus sp.]